MAGAIVWICMDCGHEQPDQELQCQCGNIDPILFEEKDIYHEQAEKDKIEADAEVTTMVEETPTEKVTTLVDDTPPDEDEEKDEPVKGPVEDQRAGARGRWRR